MNNLVYVVRSRASASERVSKTKVYLKREPAVARARKWQEQGYIVEVEVSPTDFHALGIEVE